MQVVRFESAQASAPKGGRDLLCYFTGKATSGLSTLPLDTAVKSQCGYEALLGGYVIDRRKHSYEPEMVGYYGSARPLSMRINLDPGYLNDAEAEMQKITPLKAKGGIAA